LQNYDYDNFWHKDAHGNITSLVYLIFFVKLKTENQLIRFEAAPASLYVQYVVRYPAMRKVSLIGRLTNG